MADPERFRLATPDAEGVPTYPWVLTTRDKSDLVKLVAKPCILPVVFVPGIMGSNLRDKATQKAVWRLDATGGQPVGLLWKMARLGPGARQKLLHPDRLEVDPDGDVPTVPSIGNADAVRQRGWGSVGETSYKAFLRWLEQHLNQVNPNPARWSDFYQDQTTISAAPKPGDQPRLTPGVKMGIAGQPFGAEKPFQPLKTDDLLARARFNMPVHAFGYNWLASCRDASKALAVHIESLIKQYDSDPFWCQQVMLITHSMGGLVARHCASLPGMADKIAGVVHGVMPALGAAVAYRRCKVGMRDESYTAGLVIGSDGREVTAVFAQAPGALQLLPNKDYPSQWLRVEYVGKAANRWPAADPYSEVYRRRDTWWSLVREDWLSPTGGSPISWVGFQNNLDKAEAFHDAIKGKYHANSQVIYGDDKEQPSYEAVTWKVTKGIAPDASAPPGLQQIIAMKPNDIRHDGGATAYVGGKTEVLAAGEYVSVYESSHWELHCETQDGQGDGTVPASSGKAPGSSGAAGVQQQFAMSGFGHEPAFKNDAVQRATLYAITKMASLAKKP